MDAQAIRSGCFIGYESNCVLAMLIHRIFNSPQRRNHFIRTHGYDHALRCGKPEHTRASLNDGSIQGNTVLFMRVFT